MGWPVGGLRLPLCELSDTQTQAVAKVLRELELL